MLGNSIEFGSKFTHKAMQDLASFARTMNMATQAIAKANADIATTGGAACVINGVSIAALTAETGRTLANDLQFTIWLTATAYTAAANDTRYVADDNGRKQWYKCIADHTSAAGTMPGQSDNANATWRTYWTESTSRCEPAVGTISANGITRYFLALADNLGVVTTVIADNGYLATALQELVIPHFDPEVFCAVGLYTLTGTGASTWGTTDDNAQVGETQFIGPVYPSDLLKEKFSYKHMQDICAYAKTRNMASQAVAKADEDIADTGDAHAVINNDQDESLAQDAALDISADLQFTIWLAASSYTVAAVEVRYITDDDGKKHWFRCIADHTATVLNKPSLNPIDTLWKTYWVESSNKCIQASGDALLTTFSRYYLILKSKTVGTLTSVLGGEVALDADVELSIPQFDPEWFVAVAHILKDAVTARDVWGTDDDNADCTVTQIIGPVFPSGTGIEAN